VAVKATKELQKVKNNLYKSLKKTHYCMGFFMPKKLKIYERKN